MSVIMKDNVQYGYTTKGTVFHTLSNAEYEALTEEEKMNGDVYCIPDREPVINPDQLWEKVGTGTLDIGDDLTDGVNQLNSRLNVLKTKKTISGTTDTNGLLIPSTSISANSYMVISAYTGGSCIVIPFVAASNNSWIFKVLYSNMSQAASQNVTITYLAVEFS